jgi:hypothetical protein
MSIVVNTDFIGEYHLPDGCYNELDTFIATYEKKYLLGLFGAELYTLFIADLTATDPQAPQTPRFTEVFNSFAKDESECLIVSDGIRKMMVQLIYFHYVREGQVKNTANGTVKNNVELGTNASHMGNGVQSYNQGVRNSHAIQWYINDKTDVYPEENMQFLEYTSGI